MDRESVTTEDFETFYRQNVANVFRFVLMRGTNRADAEDIVQEAFVDLHMHWDKVTNPNAWLWTVCSRKVAKFFHRSAREIPVAAVDDSSAVEADPAETVEARLEFEDLLNEASPTEAAALTLLSLGYSQAEAAIEVGSTVAQVRKLLRKQRRPQMTLDDKADENDTPQQRRVRQVLRMLPQRQHDVFMLRLDGLSPKEIGQRLDMSDNNARVTQHHASKAVAEALGLKAPYEAIDYVREQLTPADA